MKTQVSEVTVGSQIKVKVHENSDGSKVLVPAHTKSADAATVTGIETAGRYVFIDTTAGQIMIGAAGKVTLI